MILKEVEAALSSQLDDQAKLGVSITPKEEVQDQGPTNKGEWHQIKNVTAVFVDLKRSTELSATDRPKVSALAYTYFVRAMAVIFDRFGSKYVDIQGDGVFGLFSGPQSEFFAVASAITAKTQIEHDIAVRFEEDTLAMNNSTGWPLTAGIGIDRGTLLVRRLGLRGTKMNEVWAGKPVNMAAKLSSVASSNQVAVSDRVFSQYEKASKIRQRALLWACGCSGNIGRSGLEVDMGWTKFLWTPAPAPGNMGLDFHNVYSLETPWCCIHGAEFCETIVTGRKPKS